MLSESLTRFLRSDFKKLTIIWGAFQAAAAIYWLISRIMSSQWGPGAKVETGLVPVFFGLAALVAVASVIYQRWAFSEARIVARRKSGLRANASTDALMAQRSEYANLDEGDRGLVAVFAYVQTSYIVTWAMQEAIAVFGLVMTIVTQDASNMPLFSIAAFAMLYTSRQKMLGYLEWAARRS